MNAPGAFVMVVGEVYDKVQKPGYNGSSGSFKLTIGYDNKELGLIGSVTFKLASAADLEKAPPKGAKVRAIFKSGPSGEFDNEFRRGDLVALEVLEARHPTASPLGR